jgi:hypothetical protein
MWRKIVESAAAGVQIGKTPEQSYSLIYSRGVTKAAQARPMACSQQEDSLISELEQFNLAIRIKCLITQTSNA